MNLNELETDIKEHKERFRESYSDIAEVAITLFMLHQKLFDGVSRIQEQKYRLNNSEVDVLITTFVSGDENYLITPTKLHQKLLFTTGAITKVLKKLTEKEYIVRVDDEYDKRSKLVQLTPKGIEITKEVFEDIMSFQKRSFSILTKREIETFKRLITKVLREI